MAATRNAREIQSTATADHIECVSAKITARVCKTYRRRVAPADGWLAGQVTHSTRARPSLLRQTCSNASKSALTMVASVAVCSENDDKQHRPFSEESRVNIRPEEDRRGPPLRRRSGAAYRQCARGRSLETRGRRWRCRHKQSFSERPRCR